MFRLNGIRKATDWLRCKAGTAALEFGLMAPFLIMLVVATVEVGSAVYQGMEAQNAAEAGAVYASRHGFDTAGITGAVLNATPAAGITAAPAPTQFCGCPTAGGIADTACATTCSDGTAPGQYLRITARITHDPLLSFSGLVAPVAISGEAVVRMY